MLNQLLETKQVTQRTPLGTVVSVALHVCVIASASALSQHSATALDAPAAVVVRIPITPADPAPVKPTTTHDAVVAQTPHGSLRLPPIADVPLDIPAVNLNAAPTNTANWTGAGVAGGTDRGTDITPAPIASGDPYLGFQVETPAAALPGSASPSYPEALRSAGVDGEALVEFVVDTLGRAELSSFKVLRASHDAFGVSVRETLPRMRFLPAELDGQRVRMLVQQAFTFAVHRQ